LKTLSDPQRKLVNLQPKDTTAAVITQLARPPACRQNRLAPLTDQVV